MAQYTVGTVEMPCSDREQDRLIVGCVSGLTSPKGRNQQTYKEIDMDGNTINEVIDIIHKRSEGLMAMSRLADAEDVDFAQQLRMRAWELDRCIEVIEEAHASTPSSKVA